MQPSLPNSSGTSSDTSLLDKHILPAQTPHLKIAHVLFMDVIGYSRLPMRVQAEVQTELRRLVEATDDVRAARSEPGQLICRPTGDGMALLFFHDLLSPVRCALAVSQALQSLQVAHERKWGRTFALRMGIHSGPVLCTEDINAQSDVAGEGIVLAQRVMDAGDAGHILLSKTVADVICRVDPFHRCLHDMGIFRAKHGQEVHLFNLYGRLPAGGAFGIAALPYKVGADAAERLEKSRKRPVSNVYREAVVAEERVRSSRTALLLMLATFLLLGGGATGLCFISPTFREFAASVAKSGMHATDNVEPVAVQTTTILKGKANETTEPAPVETVGIKIAPASSGTLRKPVAAGKGSLKRIPNLAGHTFAEAEALSRTGGFEFEQSKRDVVRAEDSDVVRRQDPKSGSLYPEGTPIYVTVMGTSPTPTVETPAEPVAAPVEKAATPEYTGVIIDVRHLMVPHAQYPCVHGPNGEHLYPADDNQPNSDDTQEDGIIGYCDDISTARARARCGTNPLKIRAVSVEGSTVRISAEGMEQFQQVDERLRLTRTFKHVAFWTK